MIQGLVAYGWTYEELSRCQSRFMITLCKYVDPERLTCGEIQRLKPKDAIDLQNQRYEGNHADIENSVSKRRKRSHIESDNQTQFVSINKSTLSQMSMTEDGKR